MEADLARGAPPAVADTAVLMAVARTTQLDRILLIIVPSAAIPDARQNCSKLALTCTQASPTIAGAAAPVTVLSLFMALLSSVDSTPRAYRLKAGNAAWKVSTAAGTSPLK